MLTQTTQHVLIHTCYLQCPSKGKETHGQPKSPLCRTRRHTTNTAFHWGTAKSLKACMNWHQHIGLRVPQRHTNYPILLSHNYLPFFAAESCSSFLHRRIMLNATGPCSTCCFQSTRLDLSHQAAYHGLTVLTEPGQENQNWGNCHYSLRKTSFPLLFPEKRSQILQRRIHKASRSCEWDFWKRCVCIPIYS